MVTLDIPLCIAFSDAQFANFRMVTAGNIANGVLYRSASPVDPTRNRNTYADKSCRENGITHFINLGDSEESLKAYEGYADSYYASVKHIPSSKTAFL